MKEESSFGDKLDAILEEYGYACFEDKGDDVAVYDKCYEAIIALIESVVPDEPKEVLSEFYKGVVQCRQELLTKIKL